MRWVRGCMTLFLLLASGLVVADDTILMDGTPSELNAFPSTDAAGNYLMMTPVSMAQTGSLLPASPDPNFLLSSPFQRTPQLGDAYSLNFTGANIDATSRAGAAFAVSGVFDTGAFNKDGYSPLTVALDGTPDARRRGRFGLEAFKHQSNLKWDVQTQAAQSGAHLQGFTRLDLAAVAQDDGSVTRGTVLVRDAYVRIVNNEIGGWSFLGGQTQSYASHIAAMPQSSVAQAIVDDGHIARAPIVGAVTSGALAAAVERQLSADAFAGIALENPITDFDLLSPDDVKLSRFPAVIGRLRYTPNEVDTFQIAAMARFFGREDTAFVEDWTAGWGITGVVRRRLNEQNILYAGGIVGDGIGSYVSGLDRAAGPGVAQLETLEAYGGHIGLSQLWRVDQFTGDPRIWSTVAAGYVHQGDSSASSGQAMRRARQGIANLVFKVNTHVAFALEYQYLDRQIYSGADGDNHRFQISLYLAEAATAAETSEAANKAFAERSAPAPSGARGTLYLRDL